MGISISDFNQGDIVILTEGTNGAYGKYQVASTNGDSMAVLAVPDANNSFRQVLRSSRVAGDTPADVEDSLLLYRSVLWGGIPGCVGDGSQVPYGVPVNVVRVFACEAAEEAGKFFDAVVAARELLVADGESYAYEEPVEPLNSRLCKPHVIQVEDVDRVMSVLEPVTVREFDRFVQDCENLLNSVTHFVASERNRFEAFMGKVADESKCSDAEYGHLVDEKTGITSVGLFNGDIIRVGSGGSVEYLQVLKALPEGFRVKNLTWGCVETLVVESTLDERYLDMPDDCYRYSLVKVYGSTRALCYGFMVIPTRNPALVGEFEALHSLQGKLISEFDEGIKGTLYSLKKAEVEGRSAVSPDGFLVKVQKPDLEGVLNEIISLVNEAKRSGSVLRLKMLEGAVSNLIASRIEEEQRAAKERSVALREALETVAAFNNEKPDGR